MQNRQTFLTAAALLHAGIPSAQAHLYTLFLYCPRTPNASLYPLRPSSPHLCFLLAHIAAFMMFVGLRQAISGAAAGKAGCSTNNQLPCVTQPYPISSIFISDRNHLPL